MFLPWLDSHFSTLPRPLHIKMLLKLWARVWVREKGGEKGKVMTLPKGPTKEIVHSNEKWHNLKNTFRRLSFRQTESSLIRMTAVSASNRFLTKDTRLWPRFNFHSVKTVIHKTIYSFETGISIRIAHTKRLIKWH